jgi:hypothetical protein
MSDGRITIEGQTASEDDIARLRRQREKLPASAEGTEPERISENIRARTRETVILDREFE